MRALDATRVDRRRALAGFTAFGLFWGAWGAVLPAVRADAGVDDGQLGIALLMIGVGALLTMRITGTLIDRLGARVLPVAMVAFALCGVLPALAGSAVGLAVTLLLLGASSGATDVAINAAGAQAEATTGAPVLNLAHGLFSIAVVVASLGTAAVRAAGVGATPVLVAVAGSLILISVGFLATGTDRAPVAPVAPRGRGARLRPAPVLLLLGATAALAYLVENAWQSWSAVHMDSTLGAPPGVASLAPAVFAGFAAVGRIGGNALLRRVPPARLLAVGAVLAAAGTLLAAFADRPAVALCGIALAGLGTSVCAPTIIGIAGASAQPSRRAAAVSTVTTLAYLGFLFGPAAVGVGSSLSSLPTALAGVAGVALLLAVLAPVVGRSTKAVNS